MLLLSFIGANVTSVFMQVSHTKNLDINTLLSLLAFNTKCSNEVLLMYTLEGVSSVSNIITAYEESQ